MSIYLLYNWHMTKSIVRTYKPELQSRRSELVAWGLAFASLMGLLFLNLGGMIFFWSLVFVVFLFFAALSISLGNWMDRKTQIRIDNDGIIFQNGLRNVRLNWSYVNIVKTMPSRWGENVQVIGTKTHFEFNTLGEVIFQQKVQGQVGFQQGKDIMDEIIHRSGLTSVAKNGDSYYYSHP
jgi:hypothetical protein